MASIFVVEPNTLLRLGLLNLLETLGRPVVSTGIDYAQLFHDIQPRAARTDLMLLAAPAAYAQTAELVAAALARFDPHRILLLSDTETPPYSLLNLPPVLAGYVCKFSSTDILRSSILLALAGGKCFPQPDTAAAEVGGPAHAQGNSHHRRRWYDRPQQPLCPPTPIDSTPSARPMPHPALPSDPARREAALLHLTPRQYEILTLIARGRSMKQISRELGISMATVKTHTEALYQRLSVNNRNAAVYAATSRGATLGGRLDLLPPPAARAPH